MGIIDAHIPVASNATAQPIRHQRNRKISYHKTRSARPQTTSCGFTSEVQLILEKLGYDHANLIRRPVPFPQSSSSTVSPALLIHSTSAREIAWAVSASFSFTSTTCKKVPYRQGLRRRLPAQRQDFPQCSHPRNGGEILGHVKRRAVVARFEFAQYHFA